MSDTEQPDRTAGSVPHAYGNAIAWRWAREMPAALKRSGLLTLLYALRAMAGANGELKFQSDGRPIRIQDIARAAGCDEKDARDRIEAAILAGVVTVKGERRRGAPTLYAVLVSPCPDWSAAAAYLAEVKRKREEARQKRGGRKPAPWSQEESEEFGGPPPELEADTRPGVRGTAPGMGSGDRPPNGSGGGPPNNPGSTHGVSHDGADAVGQPQVDDGWHLQEPPDEDGGTAPGLRAIEGCGRPDRTGGQQQPLLLSVHSAGPVPPDHQRIGERMAALYGTPVPRRLVATTVLAVLGDLDLPDPTAYVLAALDADPGRYRPPIPTQRAADGA